METFIITLALTVICNFFAMRRYKAFNGSSRKMYNYLMFSSGIGTSSVYISVIVACFITTWLVPIIAFLVAHMIAVIIPLNVWGELISALLWPVFFIVTILLMVF